MEFYGNIAANAANINIVDFIEGNATANFRKIIEKITTMAKKMFNYRYH